MMLKLAWGPVASCQQLLKSGLRFSSHEVIKDERTALNLTPQQPFYFPKGFSLAFEANFRPGDGHYGNIFRIIGNDQVNIDLVSNLASPSANFWLVLGDQVLFSYMWKDIPEGAFGHWLKIRIDIDTENNMISADLNGNYQEKKVEDLRTLSQFHMLFGISKYKNFLNTDVCPMTLRNVVVYDDKEQVFRQWKLSKHAQHHVYDEVARALAEVQNPNWEIDRHIRWKNRAQFQFFNLRGVAKDETSGQVFFVNDQAVFVYDIAKEALDTIPFNGGTPFACDGNQMIYNPYTNEIWSYNFENKQIVAFNFDNRQWSPAPVDCPEPDLWHHNKLISPLDSSLLTLGGYGHYTYKSMVHQFDPEGQNAKTIDISQKIPPRYLSAAGMLDKQTVLIFGGYGSKSGRQEVSPGFYYDLYSMNIKDFSVEKLWTLNPTEIPFVPCEYLLTDTSSHSFYTLLYNSSSFESSLRLAQFNINTPEKRVFADSVPYKFLDTGSWATFFLHKKNSELIALTHYDSAVDVYSLAYPPLLPEQVYQPEEVPQTDVKQWILWGSLPLILLALFWRAKWKKENKDSPEVTVSQESAEHAELLATPLSSNLPPKSSIYLLGSFQVFDLQGDDITADFTPTLKQLFLLILLNTLKNNTGVSSVTLKDTLWFDKSATSARNNRNVNMSKMRGIFEKIGNLALRHDHSYWYISIGPEVYCDYRQALELIRQAQSSNNLPPQEISQLVQIVSRGELCPDLQTEWMDTFKADFANEITNILSTLPFQRPEIQNNHQLILSIAEGMLTFDSLNEDAIAMKCSALYGMGKKGLAKHSYDHFCREYEQILGENYALSFNDLLNHPCSPTSDTSNSYS